ncbi:hypothetical protein TB1_001435 [Malus domestica]
MSGLLRQPLSRPARLLALLDRRQRTSSLSPVQPNFDSRLPSQFSLLPACPKRTPWPPSLFCFISVFQCSVNFDAKFLSFTYLSASAVQLLCNPKLEFLLFVCVWGGD